MLNKPAYDASLLGIEFWLKRDSKAWTNEGESATRFCHQQAALFPDMFCNFYLVKNQKIAKNSTTTKGREKISTDSESLELQNSLMCV